MPRTVGWTDRPGHASPEAYDLHVGRYGSQLATALMQIAGVERGQRALDVGCGPGALTAALARRLGADRVAAVDPSEPFVRACRRRAPGADVRVGVAEDLPFVDGAFDVVLAQLVVQMLADAPEGVREMRRVARAGGVVAACVWDFAEGMTLLRAFWDAAAATDPQRAREAAAEASPPHCRPDELAAVWSEAELDRVEVGDFVVTADYSGFEDLWAPFPAGAGGSGQYCASLDDAGRETLKRELRRRLGSPSGPFRLAARAFYVRGTAPSP
jgi:SAM-dependent methyltransferase